MNLKESLSCKQTTPELQERKRTVIAELKKLVKNREEKETGFSYTFDGSDSTLNILLNFIKTERLCCPFFTFHLKVKDDQSKVLLELTGPEGAKEFIQTEIGL